ncbi:uncharacterized protein [Macrobrachium rosenbergii]|uniref:uncharacterized protein n=1 Tax=Macrobrachium rosenbergii TaxID=79674 RepID=UPI0034D6983C
MPAHSANCLLLEDPTTEPVNSIEQKRLSHPQKREGPGLCYFHQRFGRATLRCKAPCPFFPSKNGGGSSQPHRLPWQQQQKYPGGPLPLGFYIRNAISSRMILADAGAMHSVFPPSGEDHRRPPDPTTCLTAVNGSAILSYGTNLLSISTLGQRYSWEFIIVDIRAPLLGADFLAHFSLAVNISHKRLLDTQSCQSLPLSPGPKEPDIFSIMPHQHGSLLKEFLEVFKPELRQMPGTPAKHGIYHHIKMKGTPDAREVLTASPAAPSGGQKGLRRDGKDGHMQIGSQPVPVAPEDIPKTTIVTPFKSREEHLRHIWKVLQRPQESGLVVKFDKCTFGVEKVEFLDHEISLEGIRPMSSKVEAVEKFPTPISIRAAVQHFRFLLEGTPFTIWTNHQPLVHTFMKLGDTWCSRQQRHLAAIAEFTCTIKYLPGRKNLAADALSRIEIDSVQLGIDYEDLAYEQAADPET